jgi:hypothetical protein
MRFPLYVLLAGTPSNIQCINKTGVLNHNVTTCPSKLQRLIMGIGCCTDCCSTSNDLARLETRSTQAVPLGELPWYYTLQGWLDILVLQHVDEQPLPLQLPLQNRVNDCSQRLAAVKLCVRMMAACGCLICLYLCTGMLLLVCLPQGIQTDAPRELHLAACHGTLLSSRAHTPAADSTSSTAQHCQHPLSRQEPHNRYSLRGHAYPVATQEATSQHSHTRSLTPCMQLCSSPLLLQHHTRTLFMLITPTAMPWTPPTR